MAFDETYNEPESTEVLVKSLDPEHPAQLHYAHAGDAGADLITTVDVTLKPFERALVPTGVAIALPAGYVALVHPRSGLAANRASPCSTRLAPLMPATVARSRCR